MGSVLSGNLINRLQHVLSLTNFGAPTEFNRSVLGILTETNASKCRLLGRLGCYNRKRCRSSRFFIDWLCASVTIPIHNTSTDRKYKSTKLPLRTSHRTFHFLSTRKITMGYFAVGGIVVMLLVEMVVNFHQLTRALAERRAKLKLQEFEAVLAERNVDCLLYTSPSPRDRTRSRMPSSA